MATEEGHRRQPSGIPYSHGRWMDMVDRRLHVLENKRPKASEGGCCYAVLLCETEPDGDNFNETWRVASEGHVAPDLIFIGG